MPNTAGRLKPTLPPVGTYYRITPGDTIAQASALNAGCNESCTTALHCRCIANIGFRSDSLLDIETFDERNILNTPDQVFADLVYR